MARPQPLLVAYDGECGLCRRWMDRIQNRDRWGLIVVFPVQNSELIHVAPELAGLPLLEQVHGLNVGTRQVWAGAKLLPEVLRRLPRYRWLAPLFRFAPVSAIADRLYRRIAKRRMPARLR